MNQVEQSPFRNVDERKADRAEKREAVLRAAVRMFNAQGFHQTSLDDVAASLGVSKPTIYHYLGNKDQVLFECVTRGMEQLHEAVDAARAQPGTGLDRLRAFLKRYGEITMTDFGRVVHGTADGALIPDNARRHRALKKDIDREMRALVAEGQADGSIGPGDPRMIAFTAAGALNWTARWHRPDGDKSAAAVAEEMVDILIAGIAAR